jgi:hypothetical protein
MDLTQKKVPELFVLYAEILQELRVRKVVRSSNAPLGDYAEYLICRIFDWQRQPNSNAGYDAQNSNGQRYEIKAREKPSRQLSAIRNLDQKPFDYLVGALFDKAAIIPHHVVVENSKYQAHTNSAIFFLKDKIWDIPEVEDITNKVKEAILNFDEPLLPIVFNPI